MQRRITRSARLAFLGILTVATLALAQPERVPRPYSLESVPDATRTIRALGSDDDTVVSAIMDGLLTGQAHIPFDNTLMRRDAASRVRFIETFGPILKRIVASQIFRDISAFQRTRRIESLLPPLPPTYDELRAQQLAELSTAIAAAERASRDRSLPPAARAAARTQAGTLRGQKRTLSRGRGDPAVREAMTTARAQAEADRASRLPTLEAQHPADVNQLLARRLRAFLALTEDMPFDARLRTNASGRRVFEDARLEAKPNTWKLCFRAGEETIEAARAFAEQWLTTLPAAR